MKYELFDKMTKKEAALLLQEFLDDGRANVDLVRAHAERAGVNTDYSLESLPQFLEWVLSELRTVPRTADPEAPQWIRSTSEYERGLFDFDARSGNLLVFAAYYTGECFIRNFTQLRWASGNRDTLESNMVVVTGFSHGIEMAPMLVLENSFRRLIANPSDGRRFDSLVRVWRKHVSDENAPAQS